MTDRIRITLAQLNPTLGDLDGNAAKAMDAWAEGREAGADLVVLPRLFITGHPLLDLARRPGLAEAALAQVEDLARQTAYGPALAIGSPWRDGGRLYDACLICQGGRIIAHVTRHEEADCDAYDRGSVSGPFAINGVRLGVAIGPDGFAPSVAETLAESGAEILIVPDAGPYHRGVLDRRMNPMVARVVENRLPLLYLNAVGGQDELVFDGASFVLNPGAEGGAGKAAQLAPFAESATQIDLHRAANGWRAEAGTMAPQPGEIEQDYNAMMLGLRDYLAKSGFRKVLLGMSGGIDSAIVAAIAADAVGPDNVRCVMLPSEYTSQASTDDATECTRLIGARLDEVRIDSAREAVSAGLTHLMAGTQPDVTEENIQSRLRGVMLMALSNKHGEMLLSTGNKSEAAVGYATIYGDMAGGYNPIRDLYKTRVFDTCRWRNETHRDWMRGHAGVVIPPRIISKPPSAELRPDQKDSDSLPPYDILDPILHGLIEENLSQRDLIARGFDAATVQRVETLLLQSEWKRHQAAPGPLISPRALGAGRRYPMVNRFRERV
ncbi:NAD+ synthase [Paracoccus jeotgali]|uniref:NAD+ synthase n=1 Tax=Paracoccus jeotgali TaxID=2065379 RepID=UPI0028A60ED1|nr:NAD+ synthase [Paracoccus jeotgali]